MAGASAAFSAGVTPEPRSSCPAARCALVVVADGLFGARTDPAQLATGPHLGPLPRTAGVALLAAGNLFCAGCPFVLVRDAGRRFGRRALRWPRRLRTKWIGVALFVAVLFCLRAVRSLGAAAARRRTWCSHTSPPRCVVDIVFTGATFCKYLCPIGQFNFVASTMSPLELQVEGHRHVPHLPDGGLHQGTARSPRRPTWCWPARLRAAAVPAAEGRQHGLHVLPRLRARLPARQHRAGGASAGGRAG